MSSTSNRRMFMKSVLAAKEILRPSLSGTSVPAAVFSTTFTKNSVPLPTVDSNLMVPPISVTTFFAIASPRPVPCTPLMVETRSRSKASNTRSANSGEMPIPSSFTRISNAALPSSMHSFSARVTETCPPSEVNLKALLTRFRITRFMRFLSQSTIGFLRPSYFTAKAMFLPTICASNMSRISSIILRKSVGRSSSSIFPISMRLISSMSLMRAIRYILEESILARYFWICSGVVSGLRDRLV